MADRDGKPREARFAYRYTFDGKEHWDCHGQLEWPTTRDGRLVVRVPHGTSRLEGFLVARGACCLAQQPEGTKDDSDIRGSMVVFFKPLEVDKSVSVLWVREADASLKVSAKDGSVLKDVDIDARHSASDYIGLAPMGGGMYHLWHVQPDRPFTIKVKADGYEPATKEVTAPAGKPTRIEITLDKKK